MPGTAELTVQIGEGDVTHTQCYAFCFLPVANSTAGCDTHQLSGTQSRKHLTLQPRRDVDMALPEMLIHEFIHSFITSNKEVMFLILLDLLSVS